MTRPEATALILEAKSDKKITFQKIAQEVGRNPVWTTAALLGQASMSKDEADRVAECLGLSAEVSAALQACPLKGCFENGTPTDPLIYRLYEINHVYGSTIKALIHEMFGDGIMSAVDFNIELERVSDPRGDRVKLTYCGKFLPYTKW
jgi:cyanate lyase